MTIPQDTKQFFNSLCDNIFKQHNAYLEKHNEFYYYYDSPLLESERECMGMVAVSVDKSSDIMLSEVPFSKKESILYRGKNVQEDKNRRVDLWCSYGETSCFIEVKHGHYCLTNGTQNKLTQNLIDKFKAMIKQIRDIDKIPDAKHWGEHTVSIGLMPIVGYYNKTKGFDEKFTSQSIVDELQKQIHGRLHVDILHQTWETPPHIIESWKHQFPYATKFITIIGVVRVHK